MKIIIKDNNTGIVKKFSDKADLIWYIKNYLQDRDEVVLKKDTVYDLFEKFFSRNRYSIYSQKEYDKLESSH